MKRRDFLVALSGMRAAGAFAALPLLPFDSAAEYKWEPVGDDRLYSVDMSGGPGFVTMQEALDAMYADQPAEHCGWQIKGRWLDGRFVAEGEWERVG